MQTFKKPLTWQEEAFYLEGCKNGDQTARKLLIEYNLRLVAHIARKYYSPDRENEDLISVGTIGLIKAIDSFDKAKGNRLVTYASRCIENEILMMLRSEKKQAKDISLYEPVGTDKEGNEISLIDMISISDSTILDQMIHDFHSAKLKTCMKSCLTAREFAILKLRYGLGGSTILTQKDIASRLNISRSYVSRIEKRALDKLRRTLDS